MDNADKSPKPPSESEGDGYIVVLRAALSTIPVVGPLLEKLSTRFVKTGYEKGQDEFYRSAQAAIDEEISARIEADADLAQKIQSRGLAVAESGVNANGHWKRLTSGVQEVSHDLDIAVQHSGVYYVTFPAAYAKPPHVSVSGSGLEISINQVTANHFTFTAQPRWGTENFKLRYTALGLYL